MITYKCDECGIETKTSVCPHCGKRSQIEKSELFWCHHCNIPTYDEVCPICGKRFKPRDELQKYCGSACYDVAERQRAKDAWESPKPKTSHGENLEALAI